MSTELEEKIRLAHEAFDQMNARDPNCIEVNGTSQPRELALARWLSDWVTRIAPNPSVALRLAARCQHLMRFSFPRTAYPEGRVGYLKWRKDLSKRHADLATRVLFELGFDQEVIELVRKINMKQELRADAECQAMEDALCLSFLEHEYSAFCSKHADEKVIEIVQKTWGKMSEAGHQLALTIQLEGRAKDLIQQALSS
jgi:hypothetical protein